MKQIDSNSKVGFLIHTYGPISAKVYMNHMGSMLSWSKRMKMFFCGIDKHRTADARNIIFKTALSAGCTHLLIVDADHIVPDHMPECLSSNRDALIASGVVCRRKPPYEQVGFCLIEGTYRNVRLPLDGRSYSVDIPAMGATLFDIRVFDKIPEPWFVDTKGEGIDGSTYNKRSDTNFFEKAQEAGIAMVVDTRVVIGHVGDESVHYPNAHPTHSDLNREYGIRMDEDAMRWQALVYEMAKNLVIDHEIKSILDLGCGNPIKLKNLDQKVSIIGIDFPEKIEAISRRQVRGEWIGRDLNHFFDLKRTFDLIIASDVIEHVDSVTVFFDIIQAHLAPGGLLLISSPEMSTTGGGNPLHVQEFTKEELSGIIGAHGFEVLKWVDYKQDTEDRSYCNNVFICRLKGERDGK